MADVWSKLDNGLLEIYTNYLYLLENGWDDSGWLHPALEDAGTHIVPVTVRYTGNVNGIVVNGFTLNADDENECASAFVDLDQLENISAHPQVLELLYGTKPSLSLDESAIEIHARKALSGGAPFAWEVERSTGIFNGITGDGVIIGIIDTGIDFRNKVFFKNNTPETRILRIWDQGLKIEPGEKSPEPIFLKGPKTYGVEYTEKMINDVLQKVPGAPPVRHRDCSGHGTHVSAIAAGDGRQPAFLGVNGYDYVGVAPKASLIVVNHMALQKEPKEADTIQQFKDAVTYILRTAKILSPARPVVINCSLGGVLGPHDGREVLDTYLFENFNNTPGQACVFATGNAAGLRQHGIITIPGSKTTDLPFQFLDDRGSLKKSKFNCIKKTTTHGGLLEIWYDKIAPDNVNFSVKLPGATSFTAALPLGGTTIEGIISGKKKFKISHAEVETTTSAMIGPNVKRNRFRVFITPEGDEHQSGIYTIKIDGPEGTKLHAWGLANPSRQNFTIQNINLPDVAVTDENTIGSFSAAGNVISVAAYDDTTGKIAPFSSNGPLVSYSGSAVIADKPDIAAPGVNVNAAKSTDHDFLPDILMLMLGLKYLEKSGTSMAAPHIAGVVALMLQKNKALTSTEIKKKLKDSKRTATPAISFGSGKVDVKQTLDNV